MNRQKTFIPGRMYLAVACISTLLACHDMSEPFPAFVGSPVSSTASCDGGKASDQAGIAGDAMLDASNDDISQSVNPDGKSAGGVDAADASTVESSLDDRASSPETQPVGESDANTSDEAAGGGTEEETFLPTCFMDPRGFAAPTTLGAARSIGVSLAPSVPVNIFQAYAVRAGDRTVTIRWLDAAGWTPWGCFDLVPYADRVVGANLKNGFVEVFVTTQQGKVYVRREFQTSLTGWTAWTPFGLPSCESRVSDLAVSKSADARIHVYAVDRGRVFMRYKTTDDTYGPYGSWHDVGMAGGSVVTACLRSDGRQQVFSTDSSRHPLSAVQSSPDLGSAFQTWTDFDASGVPALVDIDCGQTSSGSLLILAADTNGQLWTRTQETGDQWGSWMMWAGPTSLSQVTSIASVALTSPGSPVLLMALTADGMVHSSQLLNGAWSAWEDRL